MQSMDKLRHGMSSFKIFFFFEDAPKKPGEDIAAKTQLQPWLPYKQLSFTGSDSQTETLEFGTGAICAAF